MEDGWSVKKLHRLIMLSSVYQQSSEDNPEFRRLDPENTLLWRMNRQRLDFEAMRDSILAVSGELDRTMGGLPVSLTSQPSTRRRTVYAFIDRAKLPSLFPTFDFPSPDQHSPQRYLTTVPQQALFMMNSPFVAEQARNLVQRPEIAAEKQARRRVELLYRLVYGRAATPDEVTLDLQFVEADPGQPEVSNSQKPTAWQYGLGEYDPTAQCVKNFEPFRFFTNDAWPPVPLVPPDFRDAWQPVSLLPDPRSGNAHLTAEGGEPPDDSQHLVIRRWVAPLAGRVSLSGTLRHRQDNFKYSDGVQARIVSSRAGELASWVVSGMEAETKITGVEVKQGDTVDFIVGGRANSESDAFFWLPVIEMAKPPGTKIEGELKWSAGADFRGPSSRLLTTWEKYAQVLLQSNEFAFVD